MQETVPYPCVYLIAQYKYWQVTAELLTDQFQLSVAIQLFKLYQLFYPCIGLILD